MTFLFLSYYDFFVLLVRYALYIIVNEYNISSQIVKY